MRDYNRELKNRFKNCKDIDNLILKLSKDINFTVEKLDLGENFNIEEIAKLYDLKEIKAYKITKHDMQKSEITILYRNYNEEEMQEILDLRDRELEEMGATGVEIFKNEIIRVFY